MDFNQEWCDINSELGHNALLKKETLGSFYNAKQITYDYHFDDGQLEGTLKYGWISACDQNS